MSEKTVHAGHRARMRERFIKEGLSGFSEHEVLEFLLMFAIPQRDVNPLAHRLIDRFGSLSAVLESSPAELTRVDGVGENAAALLSLMPQLMGYYQHSAMGRKMCIRDSWCPSCRDITSIWRCSRWWKTAARPPRRRVWSPCRSSRLSPSARR